MKIKVFLRSGRFAALVLAAALAVTMLCLEQVQKLGDAPLKAKATWHAMVTVAAPEE